VIVAPHTSFLDVFVLGLFMLPTFVAREDMGNLFFFGRECGLSQGGHGVGRVDVLSLLIVAI